MVELPVLVGARFLLCAVCTKLHKKYKKRKTQYNKLDNYFCKLIIGSNQGKGNSSIQSPGEMTKTYKSQLDRSTGVSSALTNHLKTVMNRDDK